VLKCELAERCYAMMLNLVVCKSVSRPSLRKLSICDDNLELACSTAEQIYYEG
jgi:hypothetical protein